MFSGKEITLMKWIHTAIRKNLLTCKQMKI